MPEVPLPECLGAALVSVDIFNVKCQVAATCYWVLGSYLHGVNTKYGR